MKIALTHPYSWPEVRRGAERIIRETARALAKRGHDVTILTAGSSASRQHDDGVTIIKFRRLFRNPDHHERWFGWRLLPNLATGRFDAVHSFMPYDALAAIRTRSRTGHRTVYEELGIPAPVNWANRPDRSVRRRIVRDIDVYGCMSRHALSSLEHECNRAGNLIPGGVRMDKFVPAPSRNPVPTLLFSGALNEPRKGLGDLLQALDLLSRDESPPRLWLSGPGDAKAQLASATPAARQLVEVLALGDPENQADRYGRAWVTVLPSVNDSFGMVLLESLACGTPIVAANHAAPPELVLPETGALSEPGDPASLARAMRAGLDLARQPQTVEACRSFAAGFDWNEALAPMLERLYAARTIRPDASAAPGPRTQSQHDGVESE
jgi:phosphatidyl-myo-inositol alpha-mannosyltransferase